MFKYKFFKYILITLTFIIILFLVALFRLSYKPLEINFLKDQIYKNNSLQEIFGEIVVEDIKVKLNLFENKVNIGLNNLNYLGKNKGFKKIRAKNFSFDVNAISLLQGKYKITGLNINNGDIFHTTTDDVKNINFETFFEETFSSIGLKNIQLSDINIKILNKQNIQIVEAIISNSKIIIKNNNLVIKSLSLPFMRYKKNNLDILTFENITISELSKNQYLGKIEKILILDTNNINFIQFIKLDKKPLVLDNSAIRINLVNNKLYADSNLKFDSNEMQLALEGNINGFDLDEVNLVGEFKKINVIEFLKKQKNLGYKVSTKTVQPLLINGNFELGIKAREIKDLSLEIFYNEKNFNKYTLVNKESKDIDVFINSFLLNVKYENNILKILDSKFSLKEGHLDILGQIENLSGERHYKLAFTLNDIITSKSEIFNHLKNKSFSTLFNNINEKGGTIKQAFFEIEHFKSIFSIKSFFASISSLKVDLNNIYKLFIPNLIVELQSQNLNINTNSALIIDSLNNKIELKDARIIFQDYSKFSNTKSNYSMAFNVNTDYQNFIKLIRNNKFFDSKAFTVQRLQGDLQANVKLKSRYNKELKKGQLKYNINSKLKNFNTIKVEGLSNIPFKLEEFNGILNATNNLLQVNGDGFLNKSKMKLNLKIDEDKRMQVQLNSIANHKSFSFLKKFNYLKDGTTILEVKINKDDYKSNEWSAFVSGNLYKNETIIDYIDYSKKKNEKGFLQAKLYFDGFTIKKIENLKFFTEEILINADFIFNKDGKLKIIEIHEYLNESENIRATISNLQSDTIKIDIKGNNLNIHKYLLKEKTNNNINFELTLDIQNLYLDERNLGHVDLITRMKNSQITSLSGTIYYDNIKYVEFKKSTSKNKEVSVNFENLGLFLNNINLTDNMTRGTGKILLKLDDKGTEIISGTYNIKDYSIRKASYLARLLQLASFTGLLEILSVEGIPFSHLKGDFTFDKGTVNIKNTRLEGISLGASVEGYIDLNKKNINLQGVLIPAYAINSIINKIPLVGDLVTGIKGEGLIGVNYKAQGNFDKPDYSINPLSILTPGIMRNIFDIFKEDKVDSKNINQ